MADESAEKAPKKPRSTRKKKEVVDEAELSRRRFFNVVGWSTFAAGCGLTTAGTGAFFYPRVFVRTAAGICHVAAGRVFGELRGRR